MNILLADDQAQIRSALRLLLEQEPGVVVTGEVATTRDLLSRIQIFQADVVLLDWELPGMEAEKTLTRLRTLCPTVVVVALSGRPEARDASLVAGADAFVSKVDPPDRLLGTVRALISR
jgi:DNA-binding NarL/FixJ family response regulator